MNHLQVGSYDFYQTQDQGFGSSRQLRWRRSSVHHRQCLRQSGFVFHRRQIQDCALAHAYGGMRPTFFNGGISESAASPRFGATVTIPRLNWTLPRFLRTLLPGAAAEYRLRPAWYSLSTPAMLAFIPLHGERDEEHQFGVIIPYRGWVLDADTFRTRRRQSSRPQQHWRIQHLLSPHRLPSALIRAWELTLRSPRIVHRVQLHLAYSNQIAEGGGVVTGGLVTSRPSARRYRLFARSTTTSATPSTSAVM